MKIKGNPFIEMSRVIQGEGSMMGRPFLLLRVWGCPYRCKFGETVCDTAYAWSKPKETFSVQQAIYFVSANRDIKNVMITGGEPTMWDKEMCEFLVAITSLSIGVDVVLVETAGYKVPTWSGYVDVWSVSPKIGAIPSDTINWYAISEMVTNYGGYMKFVAMSVEHAEEIMSEIENMKNKDGLMMFDNIDKSTQIWMMPEGTSWEGLRKLRADIVDFCAVKGISYSDRLHIVAFGKEIKGK